MPWILTEYALESNRADILQYSLFNNSDVYVALDLYNDAAFNTLYNLQSQVIYDEIEAEVNLCFDQFMFKLGQKIFIQFKKVAALMKLPTDLKTEAFEGSDPLINRDPLSTDAYGAIIKQKNYSLLGRNLDVSKLLGQIFCHHLRSSINAAISRFEASDLTYIMVNEK